MTTDDLIQRLGREGAAVTPLPSPMLRTVMWLIGAVAFLTMMTLLVRLVMGAAGQPLSALFLGQQAAALLTGALAAYGALSTVVPGANASWRFVLLASGVVWVMLLAIGLRRDVLTVGTAGVGAETDWPCVALIAVGGAVLSASLVRMLRRGAPFAPRLAALLSSLGAFSLASIQACLARPHAYTATVIIWHGATLVLLAIVLGGAGRLLLPWHRPALSTDA